MMAIAPTASVVDLTHEVAPQDVQGGAVVLARAVAHLPVCVHLAVVDPGVGTERAALAVATQRGDVLVGPDNGLLAPAAHVLGGVVSAVTITPAAALSSTFHGRDLFAPAAARVAAGAPVTALGPTASTWHDLELPAPAWEPHGARAEVLMTDHFGNAQLNVEHGAATSVGLVPGAAVELAWNAGYERTKVVRTFGELAPGDLGVLIDSDGYLAMVVRDGSAVARGRLARGTRVRMTVMA